MAHSARRMLQKSAQKFVSRWLNGAPKASSNKASDLSNPQNSLHLYVKSRIVLTTVELSEADYFDAKRLPETKVLPRRK
jgi:hypothetical protein